MAIVTVPEAANSVSMGKASEAIAAAAQLRRKATGVVVPNRLDLHRHNHTGVTILLHHPDRHIPLQA